ncbi:lycopene cyclase domain-containing protein [Ulvibacter litoralis]|uniref:Lycopene cyclase domain-containing protein n=1 Tax=Ulvibacter litoralis TaxID=227084 RepID=A0A1G7JF76_9FLAO|nr:lycopene cyclase domain-containing protein [Ulvibacter litoralis]GHC64705.1 hypothetical protein GCM10008083_32430 [Ulvibacter litoralis]SDF23139.1 lycopene cyclase domain-containing protein [Ulvibacter litoralis]
MEYLYLWLDLGSLSIPFLVSFHPKLQFHKKWRSLFPAIAIMMAFFIPWDSAFTQNGFWGFNETYVTGYKIFSLPIEEWLFFICIPYACLFTHYSVAYLFPKIPFSEKTTNIIYTLLMTLLLGGLIYNYDRWYPLVNFSYAILLLGFVYNYKRPLLAQFLPTFIIILIPFLLINGILTGTGIDDEVVWYLSSETMNIRILTIPIEDSIYALSMLLTVFVLTEYFENRFQKSGLLEKNH